MQFTQEGPPNLGVRSTDVPRVGARRQNALAFLTFGQFKRCSRRRWERTRTETLPCSISESCPFFLHHYHRESTAGESFQQHHCDKVSLLPSIGALASLVLRSLGCSPWCLGPWALKSKGTGVLVSLGAWLCPVAVRLQWSLEVLGFGSCRAGFLEFWAYGVLLSWGHGRRQA